MISLDGLIETVIVLVPGFTYSRHEVEMVRDEASFARVVQPLPTTSGPLAFTLNTVASMQSVVTFGILTTKSGT